MRLALISIIALAACGDDAGAGGPYTPIDQVQAAYTTGMCEHLVACGEFPDQTTCESATIVPFDYAVSADVVAAVRAGTVIYDGRKMQHCIETLANATCDRTDQDGRVIDTSCLGVIRGTVAAGGACAVNAECLSQVCMQPQAQACEMQCCPGTCVGDTPPPSALAELGQPCSQKVITLLPFERTIENCVAGAYCDPMTSTCLALQPLGGPCASPDQCAYGLSCSTPFETTCQPAPLVGEPCPNGVCRDEGVTCNNDVVAMCVPYALPPMMCVRATDCSPYYACGDGDTSQCVGLTIGQFCSPSKTGFPEACIEKDAYCDPDQFKCMPLEADTMPCRFSYECTSSYCDSTMHCATPPTCI